MGKPLDYVIFPPGMTEEQKATFRRNAAEWDKRGGGRGRVADDMTGLAIRRLFMADEDGIRWVAYLFASEPVFRAKSRLGG
jgi:hypothetical protein